MTRTPHNVDLEPAGQPTYERIMVAVGDRFWQLAGPHLAEAAHRDLVFGTTWQDCMWAVEQGVMDAYGIRGIAGCDACHEAGAPCPEHEGHALLTTPAPTGPEEGR